MRLNLSENAAKQLGYTDNKVKQEKVVTQDELDRKAASEAAREKKLLFKQAKVAAREAALESDRNLQTALDAVDDVDTQIQKAENRLAKDTEAYNKRVERKQSSLQNVQRQLENLHAEMLEAKKALDVERSDVPASISGMESMKLSRAEKVVELRASFNSCEQAFKNPNLTNSAKGKRDSKLRRTARKIITE